MIVNIIPQTYFLASGELQRSWALVIEGHPSKVFYDKKELEDFLKSYASKI